MQRRIFYAHKFFFYFLSFGNILGIFDRTKAQQDFLIFIF